MATILVTFHSHEGQTAKIADRVAAQLRAPGHTVDEFAVRHAPDPHGYDLVVVGDAIRFERHSRALVAYLRRHREALRQVPVALFQVSMTSADDDTEHVAAANRLVDKLIDRTHLHPRLVATFAGALRYTQYGWVTKRVMRSIARREGRTDDVTRDHEYTDWQAVDEFARDVAVLVADGHVERPATRIEPE